MTVVEIATVVAVLGTLAGLLLPAVQQIRERAARASCTNRLRQIGLALCNYEAGLGHFPPPRRVASRAVPETTFGASWMAMLLPHVEQEALWRVTIEAFRTQARPWTNPPHSGLATVLALYDCPSDGRCLTAHEGTDRITAAYTSFLGVEGGGPTHGPGVLTRSEGAKLAEITDGASHTVIVGERPPPDTFEAGWWYTEHPYSVGPDGVLPVTSIAVPEYPICGGTLGDDGVLFRYGPGARG
jgi:hypothetical protein